jgi:hypothetical protein
MRYHWGIGVGHLYAHQHATASVRIFEEDASVVQSLERGTGPLESPDEDDVSALTQDGNSEVYDSDDPELGLEDREQELEGWVDNESEEEYEGRDEHVEEEDFPGLC